MALAISTLNKDYISYVNDNNLFIPLFRTNSGLRTFYASANRLCNALDYSTRSITTLRNFKSNFSNKYLVVPSSIILLFIEPFNTFSLV